MSLTVASGLAVLQMLKKKCISGILSFILVIVMIQTAQLFTLLDCCSFLMRNPLRGQWYLCSCGSVVEHCVSSAKKVVGLIPKERTY